MKVRAADGPGHRKQAGDMARGDSGTGRSPLALFCLRLKRLQQAAGIAQTSLANTAHLGTSQMSDILNGKIKRLPDWDVTATVVRACLEHAEKTGRPVPPDLHDEGDWRRRYGDLEHDLDAEAQPRREAPAGWPLAEVIDPFALEVHRPVQPDTSQRDLPTLPVYVPREHDMELGRVVTAAAHGSSRIVVLVGGSSTGKTRACWEALRLLRDRKQGWRLWHPIDPSRPQAALRELPAIGPRTVVWLNEAQFYLDVAADGLGERVAAGLRELLRDPARAPVLLLATLWPQFWDTLTARPTGRADPHAQARELLAGRDISVPAAFTAAQLHDLTRAADPRLVQAANASHDGEVIQFLAGAPELLARYRNAPPIAAALISAAIDARRMGMGIALPLAFLEAVAPGYLTDTEWDGLGEDWLEQALAYTAAWCKGTRGPLARIRPRVGYASGPASGTTYRLADYLDQYGRRVRRRRIPPPGFWTAAASLTDPGDLSALARAAEARGMLRDAARLHKRAAVQGNTTTATSLTLQLRFLHPADQRPARWAAAHAPLDTPYEVVRLLDALREAGAGDEVKVLASRAAAHAPLDTPAAVAGLLDVLREAGAGDEVKVLASRAAAHAPLDTPAAVAGLLDVLRRAGADDEVKVLASRAAAHAPLDTPAAVAGLLDVLRRAGAGDQVKVLASRAAAHAPLDDPFGFIRLLDALRAAGADDQVAVLLGRNPAAHVFLDYWVAVDALLDTLRRAGADDQVKVLASRAAAHPPLDDPAAVAVLLDVLRRAGAGDQVKVLASRAAAHAPLDKPGAVAGLLDALRAAGTDDQVAVLLARNPAAHAPLDDPYSVAGLLDALRAAGTDDQVKVLASRAAAHPPLYDLVAVVRLLDALRAAGTDDQVKVLASRAAADAPLDTPAAVAGLLDALREAGADDEVKVLASRAAADAPLDTPAAVAGLLDALRRASADDLVKVLASRAAAHAPLNTPYEVVRLLDALREAGADDQVKVLASRAAAHAPLTEPSAVALLLDALREGGTDDQVKVLASRAAAHAPLDDSAAVFVLPPGAVAGLLDALRRAGADDEVKVLASRAAADAPLDTPYEVVRLLDALREAGAGDQVKVLASRAAAHAPLDFPFGLDRLLDTLREEGTDGQVKLLGDRLPSEGMFDLFLTLDNHQTRYRFGRDHDGSPAPPWAWDDLD